MKRSGCLAISVLLGVGIVALASKVVTFEDADPPVQIAPTTQKPPSVQLLVPVEGVSRATLVDSWGDDREGGARRHAALDIAAPAGTPVVAAMAGKVEKLFLSDAGGITVYVRSLDAKWLAYYAHLQRYADGMAEGQTVLQGQRLGYVGDTGNAGAGNTHLHFALHRMKAGDRWYEGTAVNPYPLLADKAPSR